MRFLLLLAVVGSLSISCNEQKNVKKSSITLESGSDQSALPEELQDEDCDEKAKKAEEVVVEPENISLSGGDTGCSLDDAEH